MDQSVPEASCEVASSDPCDVAATLHVCVTWLADEQRRQDELPNFRIVEAECLSNCNRGCSVALTGPGRWSYVYGDLDEALVDDLLTGASRYAATKDGLVPWRERPVIFRKGVIARIPPFPQPV